MTTTEQRMTALAKANRIRSHRAALKRQIADGEVDLEGVMELILQPPDELLSMPIGQLIQALPKFGRTKTAKILKRARLSQHATLENAAASQRVAVCEQLAIWPAKC